MKKENLIFAGIGAAFALIILWLAIQRNRDKKNNEALEADLEELKEFATMLFQENAILKTKNEWYSNQIADLQAMINKSDEIDEPLKNKLKELIDEYQEIDEAISNELTAALASFEAGFPTKAAFALAKIVENLLRDKYQNDTDFKDFLENPKMQNRAKKKLDYANFNDYLDFAKEKGDLKDDEYHYAKGLKEVRNEEAHKVGLKKQKHWIQSTFLIGIELILMLSGNSKA